MTKHLWKGIIVDLDEKHIKKNLEVLFKHSSPLFCLIRSHYDIESKETDGLIGLVGRVFANGLGDLGSIPGWVIPKTLKMVLDTSLLNTQQYMVI